MGLPSVPSHFCSFLLTLSCSHSGSTVLQNFNKSPKMFSVGRGNLIASTSAMERKPSPGQCCHESATRPIQSDLEHFKGCVNQAMCGHLFQCLTIHVVKNFYLMSDLNLLYFGVMIFYRVHYLELWALFQI